ncbi:MAG: hypothetical protein MJ041_06160 [Acidaminococcaceae bacterium]|nr:hypothetical protein [Acidaminococcaceae bacterium]
MSIYETVKTVKGHSIYRMKGSKGFYHVKVTANSEVTFHTIKAAAAWIENNF